MHSSFENEVLFVAEKTCISEGNVTPKLNVSSPHYDFKTKKGKERIRRGDLGHRLRYSLLMQIQNAEFSKIACSYFGREISHGGGKMESVVKVDQIQEGL